MRLLYLAGVDLSLPLGHATHVRRLTEALERRGHQVRVVARQAARPLPWPGPSGGLVFSRAWSLPKLRHLTAELSSARALRREIADFAPEILLVREETLTFAPLLLRRPVRPPLVVESNGPVPEIAAANGASPLRVRLLRILEGRVLRAGDTVGAVTARLAAFQARVHGLDASRVFVVPNGAWVPSLIGNDADALRRARRVEDGEFLLAFAGNLNAMQGLEVLLQALARIQDPNIRFWIIGKAPGGRRLERLADSLGLLPRVQFLGGMEEEMAVRHLQAAQAVVAPYRREAHEAVCGEGLKVLQGLAADRPLLVSRLPGIEFLEGNEALAWVEQDSPEAWAEAVVRLQREWIRAGCPRQGWPWREGEGPGRRFIERHRTWDRTAEAWEIVFAAARRLREPGGRPGT